MQRDIHISACHGNNWPQVCLIIMVVVFISVNILRGYLMLQWRVEN
jgi:hypothetical protein